MTSTQLPHFARTGHAAHCKRCLTGKSICRSWCWNFDFIIYCQHYRHLRQISMVLGDLPYLFGSLHLTKNKNTRLALAFYCIGSLDLLGVIEEQVPASDRQLWREWLWQQQARRSSLHIPPWISWRRRVSLGGKYGSGFRPSPFMTVAHSCNPLSVCWRPLIILFFLTPQFVYRRK